VPLANKTSPFDGLLGLAAPVRPLGLRGDKGAGEVVPITLGLAALLGDSGAGEILPILLLLGLVGTVFSLFWLLWLFLLVVLFMLPLAGIPRWLGRLTIIMWGSSSFIPVLSWVALWPLTLLDALFSAALMVGTISDEGCA